MSGIDTARRALFETSDTISGISCWTHGTWKYSNRAQTYPTCQNLHYF